MPDTRSRRLAAAIGSVALAALGGAVLGVLGSFTHQSLPPVGILIALLTVAVYLAGLRAWSGGRGPALAGALLIGGVSGWLALPGASGSVVIPANLAGYAWSLGVVLIALLVLAWPDVQRSPRPQAGSIESTPPEEKDPTAP